MRASSLALLPPLCLFLPACDVVLESFAGEYWFNNKLRPDLNPLDSTQTTPGEDPQLPFDPLLITGGGPALADIVSDISLTRTGEFASQPLQNTDCLWLAPGDEMKIHWETAVRLTYIGDEDITLDPMRDSVGLCTFSHPYTRQWVADDEGNEYPYEDPGVEPHATVEVMQRALPESNAFYEPYDAFYNEYDACISPIREPTAAQPAASGCSGAFSGYHSCHPEGCAFEVVRDAEFELSNVVDGTVMNTKTLRPIVKRVRGTRQLVRPLTYDESTNEFFWSVGVLPDGRWTENFSTNLRISSVRVFGLLPSGQRVYLAPDWGHIGPIACPSITHTDDFSLRCNGVDPSTQAVNPAYFHSTADQRIAWGVAFNSDPRKGGTSTGCCEGTEEQCCDGGVCPPLCSENETATYGELQQGLYIEFTLVDLEHLEPDLFSSPRTLDFGPVEWGSSWQQQVSVTNTGGTSLEVTDVDVSTFSTGAFDARLPPNVSLPKTLAAGDHFVVTVIADSSQFATEPEGDLWIQAKTPTGAAIESRTQLRYTPYSGPIVYHLFGGMDDSDNEMHFCEDAWANTLLIMNVGDRDFIRDAYEVVGDDAANFGIEAWSEGTLDATTLPPGGADVIRVTFTPDPTGAYEQHAELVATGNARNTPGGDIRIPLVGFLDSWDNQPGCYPHAVQGE